MNPNDKIEKHFRIDEYQKKGLARLKLHTIEDILRYFPIRYSDLSTIKSINDAVKGDIITLFGTITAPKTKKSFRTKIPMAEAWIEDLSGKMKVMWFNQAYIAKMLRDGDTVKITGKVAEGSGGLYLTNPEFEKTPDLPIDSHSSLFSDEGNSHEVFGYPIYPETKFVTSKWLYHAIDRIFKSGLLDTLEEYIPESILKKYNLPSLSTAYVWVHTPKKKEHAEVARKRFAFEEVFVIQLKKQQDKKIFRENDAFTVTTSDKDTQSFISRFPFTPTKGQMDSINTILSDLKKPHPMARLLEGDVGSGKTAVAAVVSHSIISSRPNDQKFGSLQVGYMAPTEILATQLFENFITYFRHTGISIALMTGSGCRKFPSKVNPDSWTTISKPQLMKWVASGDIPIVIGTHALIQKSVKFKHLALVIIDEQHRFGTNQRFLLARGKQKETQMEIDRHADDSRINSLNDDLLYKDLSYAIRNCAFQIQNELGNGHKEIIYQNALADEFQRRNILVEREVQIPIMYQKKKVGLYKPDFVIDKRIIVELKALPFIGEKEKKQLWQYAKNGPYKLALLINFGAKKIEVIRIIFDKARKDQRASAENLRSSAIMPHLLSMTATPIPRTLALTIYGDLDVSIIDQMPSGRKPIITEIIGVDGRQKTYDAIKKEMKEGRQLYVICPRINDPDPDQEMALQVKSVTSEAERLSKEVFKGSKIGILHSKMTKEKKEEVMQSFSRHEIDILVATSVVEVGVNVPNATMIIIEGAERFGLAQLHQLRGRVIRGNHQAYCYLFADAKTQKTLDRLKALKTAKNGFELSELDLQLRGAGELGGGKQWGITDLGMEAIKNLKMVEAARNEALKMIESDSELDSYPILKEKVSKFSTFHFE
jgi:GxxExxY protein